MKNAIVSNEFDNIELVGGKAYNLNILRENNVNVPEFFVISSEMYELYVNKELDFNYAKKCINKYCDKVFKKGTLFAIRSSANVEDSENMSYAGQFKSYLNVKQKEVFDYIQRCWDFAKEKGDLKMAVIVQQMVKSQISGIGFTANPEGLLNEVVITAGQGFGNNVVEDKIPTITYYYNLNDDIYYFEKQEDAIELEKNYVENIVNSLKEIRKIYNKDMDIEWAINNNNLYILQARPITTLKDKEIIVLDNSNIVESYPNTSLPLTVSCAKVIYSVSFSEIFRKLIGDKEVEKNLDIFNNIADSVNGRIYYRISNWYGFFQFLPFSNRIIDIWQEMLGVMDKNIIHKKKDIGIGIKLKSLVNAIKLLVSNTKNIDMIEREFARIKQEQKEMMKNINKYSNVELTKRWKQICLETVRLLALPLVNDMYTFIFTSLVKGLSRNHKNQEQIKNYMSGISNLESMKPVNMLNNICKNIKADEQLYLEFTGINTNEDFERFLEKYNENISVEGIKEYIDIYADRVLEELKWETKTYRTDPVLLVEKIKNHNVTNFEKEADIDISNVNCNFILKWCLKNATKGVAIRERARMYRIMGLGMARQLILKVAENLEKSKAIEHKDDIFYLEWQELEEYVDKQELNLKQIISTRKQQYKEFEKIPAYSRLVFAGKIFNKRIHTEAITNYESSDRLVGTPVSSGEATAECLVIDDIKNIGDVKNKILVTKSTDPGWAFLLKDAAGLVAERGSLLSHTAIISRELGIPAVVNVKNATNILKNGDKIKLDANKGEIQICTK